MQLAMLLFTAALFVVLTPGVLIKLPPDGSKLTVAIVHGLVFALLYKLLYRRNKCKYRIKPKGLLLENIPI